MNPRQLCAPTAIVVLLFLLSASTLAQGGSLRSQAGPKEEPPNITLPPAPLPNLFEDSSRQVTGGKISNAPGEVRVVGVVHKTIADSSPFVSGTLSPIPSPVKAGSVFKVHYVLRNLSNHDIVYSGGIYPALDVRDSDGKLAPETTPLGCAKHFFSSCHTETSGVSQATPPHGTIHPHGKLEFDVYPSAEYNFVPGTYTMVGYVCTIQDGPECFKTSKITIQVQ
jgi:hypothetical protein